MSPQRIQLRRTKGWRKPEGAVVVARPSKWGNPFRVVLSPTAGWTVRGNGSVTWGDEPFTREQATEIAVEKFRDFRGPGTIFARDAEIQLGGRDLACWCPLDQPCHADVLLELANGSDR